MIKFKTFGVIILLCSIFPWNTRANTIMSRLIPTKGPGIGINCELFFPSLNEVNEHAEAMGLESMGKPIIMWGGSFRYGLSKAIQLGYHGAIGSIRTEKIFPNGSVKSLSLHIANHTGTCAYKFFHNNLEFTSGFDGGYYHASLTKEISSASYQFDDGSPQEDLYTFRSKLTGGTFGGVGFLGVKYRFNPFFAIGGDVGYQYAKITLKQAGKKLNSTPEVDLSGSRLRMGIDLHY